MIASGERMDFSGLSRGRPRTSTPPAASGTRSRCRSRRWSRPAGVAVPQLSGRGLGHTGGTLDKLESIPGWQAALEQRADAARSCAEVGAVICAAGDGLAPADKKLYALRDVTGTVEAIPLIASSIMSKKIAEGTGALVLDVKVGSGRVHEGRRRRRASWPRRWSALGEDAGVRTGALLTAMDMPARADGGQRAGGARVRRGAGRRRPGRRRRADRAAGPRDARRGRGGGRGPGRGPARRLRHGRAGAR